MEFEWDDNKNFLNCKKHGIDFSELRKVFNHPMVATVDSRKDYGEVRWVALGDLDGSIVVLVYTEKKNRIRLISARRATKNEQNIYFEKVYA